MSIAIKVPKAAGNRRLFDTGLEAEDISTLTDYPRRCVRPLPQAKRAARSANEHDAQPPYP